MWNVIASTGTLINPQVTDSVHSFLLTGIEAVVLALCGGATWLIKLCISRLHYDWQKSIATRVVSFAEMKIVGSEDKRKYAAAQLHAKFPRLSEDEINHILEEAVLNLQTGLNDATAPLPPAA